MSGYTVLLAAMAILFGAVAITIGVYGLWRTHDVRPRARRPELAKTLYIEFGAVIVLGTVAVIGGIVGLIR